jgi:hypothetical protein
MRCLPKSDGCEARGAANIEHIRKPRNDADALFGRNPKGRARVGRLIGQARALLARTVRAVCLRARALNCARLAPVAYATASPTACQRRPTDRRNATQRHLHRPLALERFAYKMPAQVALSPEPLKATVGRILRRELRHAG